MHEDFDDFMDGPNKRKAKISDADILETKEIALDRIAEAQVLFLVTAKPDSHRLDVIWLAPVTLRRAVKAMQGIEELRAAIFQQYIDMIEEEGEL
jgi:hypothetical protein